MKEVVLFFLSAWGCSSRIAAWFRGGPLAPPLMFFWGKVTTGPHAEAAEVDLLFPFFKCI